MLDKAELLTALAGLGKTREELVELAEKMHAAAGTAHSATVSACVDALFSFYMDIQDEQFSPADAGTHPRKCCLLYKALSDGAEGKYWRLKPKFHLFVELAEYQALSLGSPRLFWAYKDEDFVGFVADLAHSRGGGSVCSTVPSRVVQRWRALCTHGARVHRGRKQKHKLYGIKERHARTRANRDRTHPCTR